MKMYKNNKTFIADIHISTTENNNNAPGKILQQ